MEKLTKLISNIFICICLTTASSALAETHNITSFDQIPTTLAPGDIIDGGGITYNSQLTITASGASQGYITFRNMTINVSTGVGVKIQNRSYIELDNVNVINAPTFAIYVQNGQHITIKDCDSAAPDAEYLIYLAGGNNIKITGCDLFASGEAAIRIYTNGSNQGYSYYIENNIIHSDDDSLSNNSPDGISIFQGPDWVLHGLFIRDNEIHHVNNGVFVMGNTLYCVGDKEDLSVAGHRPYDIHIDKNEIHNTYHNGIMVNYGTRTFNNLKSSVSYNTLTNIGHELSPNVNAMQLNWVDDMIVERNEIDTVNTSIADGYGIILDWADTRNDRLSNNSIVRYNKITGCKADTGCGGINALFGTNNLIHHNICYGNNVGIAVARGYSTGNRFYNNTLVNNTRAGFRAYGDTNLGGAPLTYVKNNIIVNSTKGIEKDVHSVVPDEEYNVIYNCPSNDIVLDQTDILANPLFVDINMNDYHLQSGSPAINAGDVNIWSGFNNVKDYEGNQITDANGNIVIQGDIDCGAYSFQQYQPLNTTITYPTAGTLLTAGCNITILTETTGTNIDRVAFWYDNFIKWTWFGVSEVEPYKVVWNENLQTAGNYDIIARVYDSSGNYVTTRTSIEVAGANDSSVTIVNPAAGDTLTHSSQFTITPAYSGLNIKRIAYWFVINGVDKWLGCSTTSPYTLTETVRNELGSCKLHAKIVWENEQGQEQELHSEIPVIIE